MKSKEFVKMKVYEDVSAYNRAVKDAESKIKVIEVGLEWCAKHIDTDKIDRKKFLSDMVEEFNRQVVQQKGDIVKQEIAVEKLHFLLDIHITKLYSIQKQYESIQANVYVDKDDFVTGVSLEDYTRYTSTEEENEKVIRANQLIHSLDMVSKYTKIYPIDIQRGVSAFIKFDYTRNKYIPNL